ncbi:MAG: type II toxin-antitoxin system HicB family antitoxin [Pyrinomonadaceae bacterium]|nr:type II toxin-antitoxin system HicB family antitoxin [Acidobacteriota bacterium]MBK7934333.1 type II toxin-antitoxin system HicB family antitoxin [Acidobacteriota bacterium]MBP7377527.1 type II toxin-antitoxin system HicB family antitoxin [Pyrinomonadaceae bacterium]
MTRDFNILIEEDEDGMLVASVPELHGCHTQARSLDELMVRIKEAIELCLEVEKLQTPTPRFVGFQRMSVEV